GTRGGHGTGTGDGQGGGASLAPGTGRLYQAICLLWVTDDIGRAVRLRSLCDLIPLLDQRIKQERNLHPTYAVAGRNASNQLFELVSKYDDVFDAKKAAFTLSKVKLYVTLSTVKDVRDELQKRQSWLQPHYVIGTDDELRDVLLDELRLRGIQPGKENN